MRYTERIGHNMAALTSLLVYVKSVQFGNKFNAL